jgi:ABC-type glycerol-3-phosphate transport system permease component
VNQLDIIDSSDPPPLPRGSGSSYVARVGDEYVMFDCGLATMRQSSFDVHLMMASAASAALPTIIVFLIFQRFFLEGLNVGALKG